MVSPSTQPPSGSPPPATAAASSRPVRHRLEGTAMTSGADGQRGWVIGCSCGWRSEVAGTEVLAAADGEQHLTLAATRRHPTTR
jgi:hypothetical protein